MSDPGFRFRQFTVQHDRTAMKVGTDGVLLGAWTDPGNAACILDVGTGTGLIALMLAQRSPARIEAVEIDELAFFQAGENVLASPWAERITIYRDSFQHFASTSDSRYDHVVSNPPYFRDSLHSPHEARTAARHDTRLGFRELLAGTDTLLAPEGRLSVIIPDPERSSFTEEAWFFRLFPLRITRVRPHPGKPVSRCLMEFSRERVSRVRQEELLIRQASGGSYSDQYRTLTRDYYL